MADAPPPADGWSRILFTSKFGAGRDFEVSDAAGARVLFVDGKIGATPKAEVRDAQDAVVYTVKGQFLGIPKRMVISPRTAPRWPSSRRRRSPSSRTR